MWATFQNSQNLSTTLGSLQNSPTTSRSLWDSQTTFIKFVEAANNFAKLAEVRKNFTIFAKFGNNFTKFVGLPNNLWTVCKTCKNFLDSEGFWIGRSDLSVWNVFLSKHICSVNTFHLSWILFMKKINSSRYIQVDKIYGTVKKWLLVTLDRGMDFCMDLWVVVMGRWLFYKCAL